MAASRNLGPLTPASALPTSCTANAGITQSFVGSGSGFFLAGGPLDIACYPPKFTLDREAFYSPVSNCPSGFTPACSTLMLSEP
jgi:hypothetical protein